jgi:TolB-like protein/DNA-binding winged helix-turn-helix (wHTH) protein/Tfp pilus assembly protein PilF
MRNQARTGQDHVMSDVGADNRRYAFAGFTLDVGRGELSCAGTDVKLRPKSFDVLRYLVEHAGRLVHKSELLDAVWGSTVVTEGSLTQCIIDIRRAVGEQGQGLIRTVPRRGFILDVPVSQLPPPAAQPAEVVDSSRSTAASSVANEPTVSTPAQAPAPNVAGVAPPVAASAPLRSPTWRWMPAYVTTVLLLAMVVAWWMLAGRDAPTKPGGAVQLQPPANSIAVLRFLDLSPAGDHGYFADGLAEEILHLLAQSAELRVTARSSSFMFPPDAVDIGVVARQLGVAYVLEGSVRRDDDELRITAQLIDSGSNTHVWSKSYDRPFAGVLELQRDIAADVASALQVALLPRPGRVAAATADADAEAEAQDLFLHGRYLFHRRAPGDLLAAERYLDRAVQVDPGNARAWTALVGAIAARGADELGDAAYRLADQQRALQTALQIDPTLAEAHVRLARYYFLTGDRASAQAAFERAYQLQPDDPLVLATRAVQATLAGRTEAAIALERRIVQIDPLSAIYRGNFGRTLLGAGRYEEALVELRRARELVPGDNDQVDISRALLLQGDIAGALRESQRVPEGPYRDQLRVLLDETPDATAARERLESDSSMRNRLMLAEIAAFKGNFAAAFAKLDAALSQLEAATPRDSAWSQRLEIWQSPFLRALHGDPRWGPLAARLASL